MNVAVGHFKPNHSHSNALAWHGGFESYCHLVGKLPQGGIFLATKVKNVVFFTLGYHQSVTGIHRIDVEKGIKILALGTLVAWNFSCHDFSED
ncbi:Uncharacterised protein [Chlamydia trachomatis]|nr:Uncharacterised protein [Chlamydia trachomatis]